MLQFVGSYLKLLLPPAMGASRGGLLVEVYGRLILLTWMHFLGGLAFLVVFLTIIVRFPFEDDFQTELWQIPLSGPNRHTTCQSTAVASSLRWCRGQDHGLMRGSADGDDDGCG